MSTLNKVFLIGNLGKDPEMKEVGDNKVCNFSIATTKYRKDKDPLTYWHDCSAWGNLAENCNSLLNKGDSVHIEGEVIYREHEGKRYTSIFVTGFQLLKKAGDGNEEKPDDDTLPF